MAVAVPRIVTFDPLNPINLLKKFGTGATWLASRFMVTWTELNNVVDAVSVTSVDVALFGSM